MKFTLSDILSRAPLARRYEAFAGISRSFETSRKVNKIHIEIEWRGEKSDRSRILIDARDGANFGHVQDFLADLVAQIEAHMQRDLEALDVQVIAPAASEPDA